MRVAAFLLTFFLAGCFSANQTNSTNKAQQSQLFVGKYIYGFEVSSFQACNSTEGFWLNSNAKDMSIIQDASMALATERKEPYQEIYIEFIGEPDFSSPIGFEEDYDGKLLLQKLLRFSKDIPEGC